MLPVGSQSCWVPHSVQLAHVKPILDQTSPSNSLLFLLLWPPFCLWAYRPLVSISCKYMRYIPSLSLQFKIKMAAEVKLRTLRGILRELRLLYHPKVIFKCLVLLVTNKSVWDLKFRLFCVGFFCKNVCLDLILHTCLPCAVRFAPSPPSPCKVNYAWSLYWVGSRVSILLMIYTFHRKKWNNWSVREKKSNFPIRPLLSDWL